LIAEIETAEEPQWGIRRGEKGINAVAKLEDGKRARNALNEPQTGQSDEPTLSDIREALIAVYGTDYGLRSAPYLPVYRHDKAGGILPARPCAACRRRCRCAFPAWRPGTQP
jgi:hypothetical protein